MNHYNPQVDNSNYSLSTNQLLDAKNAHEKERLKNANWMLNYVKHIVPAMLMSTSFDRCLDKKKPTIIIEKKSEQWKRRRRKTEYSFIAQEQRSLLTWVILFMVTDKCVFYCDLIFPLELTRKLMTFDSKLK